MPDPALLSNYDRVRAGLAPEIAALMSKRATNIAAKDNDSEIKMNYVKKVPEGYIKKLMARDVAPRATAAEREALDRVERRRTFNLGARQVFKLADSNESWTLDHEEVRRFALNHDVAEQIIAAMDLDGDGKVQLHEWLQFMGRVWDENEEQANGILAAASYVMHTRAFLEAADLVFSKFDLNQDGELSWDEVQKFTRRPNAFGGGSDAELFLALVDTNYSASVDRGEWHTFLLDVWNKHGPDAATGFLDMLLMSFEMPE